VSKPAISVSGLVKKYGDFHAVDGITFSVNQGEIFAILGPNGAGKTTTVEILEGYRNREAGVVDVLGEDPSNLGENTYTWRERIGIVLQNTSDAGDLTVRETITHFSKYYSKAKDPKKIIDVTGLREKADAKIHTLSGGQRRRLDVALGIIGSPELLFLDEPTTGFDPEARRAFWDLIRTLRDEGTTIVLTTHYLDEAEALADRVAVIVSGKIVEISPPETLGNRHLAQARITWIESGEKKELLSANPTSDIATIGARLGHEIPELQVIRPSLEDIYLGMIGEKK
jgi:ABC-2 type transport system ATP-binding protein